VLEGSSGGWDPRPQIEAWGTRYLDASDWPRSDYIEGVWWNPAKAGAGT